MNTIPPIVREHTAALAARFEAAFGVLTKRDLDLMPLPERTAVFLSLKEIEEAYEGV